MPPPVPALQQNAADAAALKKAADNALRLMKPYMEKFRALLQVS
jgi:hypothetical protein